MLAFATALLAAALLGAPQVLALPPKQDGPKATPAETRDAFKRYEVFIKDCPYCYANRGVVLWDTYYEDTSPGVIMPDGLHWHDISKREEHWLCKSGHRWVERWDNGACHCGWRMFGDEEPVEFETEVFPHVFRWP